MKINYIILQYNLYEKTIECIKHIKENTELEYQIIVVDNCSSNDAYEKVKNYYQDDTQVVIIKTPQNLGFANGNNFGVRYASENYDYDWLIIMNNDIYLKCKLNEELLQHDYQIIGPDIYRLDTNEHQNPLPGIGYTSTYISLMTFIYQVYLVLNTLYLDFYLHKLAINMLEFINKIKSKNQCLETKGIYVVPKIHGSVILFRKDFINRFPKPFNPSTFMYLEEDFLALRCQRSQTEILYNSNLIFYHDHSSTVDSISKSAHQKSRYVYKNNIKSLKAFKNYYNSSEV